MQWESSHLYFPYSLSEASCFGLTIPECPIWVTKIATIPECPIRVTKIAKANNRQQPMNLRLGENSYHFVVPVIETEHRPKLIITQTLNYYVYRLSIPGKWEWQKIVNQAVKCEKAANGQTPRTDHWTNLMNRTTRIVACQLWKKVSKSQLMTNRQTKSFWRRQEVISEWLFSYWKNEPLSMTGGRQRNWPGRSRSHLGKDRPFKTPFSPDDSAQIDANRGKSRKTRETAFAKLSRCREYIFYGLASQFHPRVAFRSHRFHVIKMSVHIVFFPEINSHSTFFFLHWEKKYPG